MSKQTKKTKKKQETAVQAENNRSDATETLLTQEPAEASNAPQNATGEELQKPEPVEAQPQPQPELSQELTEASNAPQTASGEELQKPEPVQAQPELSQESLSSQLSLESEPVQEAVLHKNQCPRCKHVNSGRGFVFPGVNRVSSQGVWNGQPYQIVETRRTKCEQCGQVFFIKKYL
jgi:hypothetical protein